VERTILFNHIPRTGGTTLRVILNRVYGESHVFFINSKDISSSLEEYKTINDKQRSEFRVISGHGAEAWNPLLENPFRVTILREPVALFISQYYHLRSSRNSNFLSEVSQLGSLEKYVDYAIAAGQDNMMTRSLNTDNVQFINPGVPPPDMNKVGAAMLEKAVQRLAEYDAVIDLNTFDCGVFTLSSLLNWKKIPIYRPLNSSKSSPKNTEISESLQKKLNHVLRFDIDLYNSFSEDGLNICDKYHGRNLKYYGFKARQRITSLLAKLMAKK